MPFVQVEPLEFILLFFKLAQKFLQTLQNFSEQRLLFNLFQYLLRAMIKIIVSFCYILQNGFQRNASYFINLYRLSICRQIQILFVPWSLQQRDSLLSLARIRQSPKLDSHNSRFSLMGSVPLLFSVFERNRSGRLMHDCLVG